MVTKEEVLELLRSTETYKIERTVSTSDMDKFQEAICAFSNDLPNSREKGYLILGAHDNGILSGLKVDDTLMKKIAGIRSDGNILPLPMMSVERFEFAEGDLLVVEVSPALVPPVRYRGRTFIRIGPRRDIATESEERVLLEKRTSYMATFDAMPCFESSLKDIDVQFVRDEYLPQIIDADILMSDKRSLQEQMAAIHLYDIANDCPTNAAIILFGINASFFLHGCYVQYVHFEGEDTGSEILNERQIRGSLCSILPKLENFVKDAIVTARPIPVSILREQIVFNYPELALRELLMNACMHRDYQSNMPIRIYQFSNRIEILNAMRGMKYVNMFNRGIQRVKNMLRENGNPEPKFNVRKITAFEVTIQPSLSLNLVTEGEKVTKSATKSTETMNEVLAFCEQPKSLTEIMIRLGLKHRNNTKNRYINPLIEGGFLEMTIPEKPNSKNQKYIRALS